MNPKKPHRAIFSMKCYWAMKSSADLPKLLSSTALLMKTCEIHLPHQCSLVWKQWLLGQLQPMCKSNSSDSAETIHKLGGLGSYHANATSFSSCTLRQAQKYQPFSAFQRKASLNLWNLCPWLSRGVAKGPPVSWYKTAAKVTSYQFDKSAQFPWVSKLLSSQFSHMCLPWEKNGWWYWRLPCFQDSQQIHRPVSALNLLFRLFSVGIKTWCYHSATKNQYYTGLHVWPEICPWQTQVPGALRWQVKRSKKIKTC